MIITFCGHSNYLFSDDVKQQLKNILVSEIIKNPTCKFYLGGYGDFDGLCLRTLKDLKADFPEIELIFITPYLDKNYSKLEFAKYHYDDVIFPPLENVPRKSASSTIHSFLFKMANLRGTLSRGGNITSS